MEFPFTGLVSVRNALEVADTGKAQLVNLLGHGEDAGLGGLADDVGAPFAVGAELLIDVVGKFHAKNG